MIWHLFTDPLHRFEVVVVIENGRIRSTKAALAGSVQAALEVLPHHVQHHHLSLLKTNSSKFVLCLAGQEEGWRQVVVLVYYTY